MVRRTFSLLCCGLIACLAISCSDSGSDSATTPQGKPVAYVPVPPYKQLASRIAGDTFEVRTLVSESDDPHDYQPTPKQIASLSRADVLFTGVMPFEAGLTETLGESRSKIKIYSLTEHIDLLEGSCDQCGHGDDDEPFVYVVGEDDAEADHEHHHHDEDEEHHHEHEDDHEHAHHDHDHDHHHDHDHDHDHSHELDPHVWLSPQILKKQAEIIAQVLKNTASAPDAAATIEENLATVLADLDALDQKLATQLAPIKGESFYVYHGAFAYFAQAYGLEQIAIELAGRRPEPKRLTELVKQAKEEGVKIVFVQPQFDQSSAKSLADAIGGKVLPLDPLKQDIFANLETIADTIGGM